MDQIKAYKCSSEKSKSRSTLEILKSEQQDHKALEEISGREYNETHKLMDLK